jgi:hypothetical protein
VYAWLEAKVPVTVSGVVVPETDKAIDGLEVAVYEVIAEPPVAPAVNGTDKVVELVTVTVPIVGACGTVVAVIEDEAADAGPVAVELVGVTVNV